MQKLAIQLGYSFTINQPRIRKDIVIKGVAVKNIQPQFRGTVCFSPDRRIVEDGKVGIYSIKAHGESIEAYHIEVDSPHTYVADNVVVHNCVALVKGLMEFLGVPNPYAARGNAKDAGDSYIRQGLASNGRGWLTIVVNRSMGGGYGHIWVDLLNEANYEQNGKIALKTTKNTRPIAQGQQHVNFDQWVLPDPHPVKPTTGGDKVNENDLNFIYKFGPLGRDRGPGEGNDVYLGKTAAFVIGDHANSKEGKQRAQNLLNIGSQAARVPELERKLAEKPAATTPTPSGEYVKVIASGTDLYVKK